MFGFICDLKIALLLWFHHKNNHPALKKVNTVAAHYLKEQLQRGFNKEIKIRKVSSQPDDDIHWRELEKEESWGGE